MLTVIILLSLDMARLPEYDTSECSGPMRGKRSRRRVCGSEQTPREMDYFVHKHLCFLFGFLFPQRAD